MRVTTSNKNFEVNLLRVTGTGLMGVWLFEVAADQDRWFVEFIPEKLPYGRVSMLPKGEGCLLPKEVSQSFSEFIKKRHEEMPVQRLRKPRKTGPEVQLQSLANLILNEEIAPPERVEKEVQQVIVRYFQNPQFIQPLKGKEHRYFFRSADMGRFFITQCPPTVS